MVVVSYFQVVILNISVVILGFQFKSGLITINFVCSPCGWDSDKKIAILAENLMTIKADEEFEAVIKRPPQLRRPANRDGEVAAEDHQDFLNRCQGLLAKGEGLSLFFIQFNL